jgi:hypothetical protein
MHVHVHLLLRGTRRLMRLGRPMVSLGRGFVSLGRGLVLSCALERRLAGGSLDVEHKRVKVLSSQDGIEQ